MVTQIRQRDCHKRLATVFAGGMLVLAVLACLNHLTASEQRGLRHAKAAESSHLAIEDKADLGFSVFGNAVQQLLGEQTAEEKKALEKKNDERLAKRKEKGEEEKAMLKAKKEEEEQERKALEWVKKK